MTAPLWSELAAPVGPFPTLSGRAATDVCVVGLGGSGLAALAECARRGVAAIGVDGGRVAGGAAGRNGGFLLAGLAHFHHDAVARLGRARAVACYRATEDVLGALVEDHPDVARRVGSLRVAADEVELADCQLQLAAMRQDGLAVEAYEGGEGAGLLFPNDAAFQPVAGCRAVAERLSASRNVQLFEETPVVAVEPGRVRCAAGEVEAAVVIVCVDGGLEVLLPELAGVVRSARLQMLATAPLGERVTDRLAYCRHGYDYYQQLASGELLLGGCRDIGGESEWTNEALPSPAVQLALDALLAQLVGPIGLPTPPVTHRWAGIVGYTRSGLPVMRRVADGVYAAGGYCGTGNVIGRIAGRALVELALDGQSAMAELFDAPE